MRWVSGCPCAITDGFSEVVSSRVVLACLVAVQGMRLVHGPIANRLARCVKPARSTDDTVGLNRESILLCRC